MALLRVDPLPTPPPSLYTKPCRLLSQADPVIGALVDKVGPCQLRPRRDTFATLCDSIIAQQLSPRAAATIYRRFAGLFPGRRPRPGAAAGMHLRRLYDVGLSPQKAIYIRDLAKGFLDGRIQPKRFGQQGNEEIIAALSSIKGIGRWTAEMFLIFALNRLDVLPVDDLGIQKAVQRWYRLRTLPGAAKLRAIAKPWAPYETLACWYLWHSLRL